MQSSGKSANDSLDSLLHATAVESMEENDVDCIHKVINQVMFLYLQAGLLCISLLAPPPKIREEHNIKLKTVTLATHTI